MAAYYIINVYKKVIGFVGLGNNLGYLKTSNYVINGPCS